MYVFFDTETHRIEPGMLIPPMVSLAFMTSSNKYRRRTKSEIYHARFDRRYLLGVVEDWLEDDRITIWGLNTAFDMGVLAKWCPDFTVPIFDKYCKGLIRDVRLRCRLHDIRRGTLDHGQKGLGEAGKIAGHTIYKYSMEGMALRFIPGYIPHKNDWQLRFGELDRVKISDWREAPRVYALEDPDVTYEIGRELPDEENHEAPECRSAFALHLSASHGMRVDIDELYRVEDRYETQATLTMDILYDLGLLRCKRDGTASKIKAAVQAFVEQGFQDTHGLDPPRTKPTDRFPTGQTSTARGVLQQIGGYPGIKDYMEYSQARHMLSTFVPPLKRAGEAGVPVTPRIQSLVNSGRPSCSNPNLYNPPKAGGIRPCMIPSKGNVYVAADYSSAELHGFAQTCKDWGIPTTMGEIINEGGDVHCRMTAELLGMSYETAVGLYKLYEKRKDEGKKVPKDARKVAKTRSPLAKAAVFGGLGGLGAMTFVEFCWSWNLFISKAEAEKTLATLKRAFPEIKIYFEVINNIIKSGPVVIPRSGFTRGRLRFTQGANTHFQTPIAHGAKDAAFAVAYQAYCVPSSALYGTRTSLFLYDEIIQDAPKEQAEEAAGELEFWMKSAMDTYVPDYPSEVDAKIMDRWRDK